MKLVLAAACLLLGCSGATSRPPQPGVYSESFDFASVQASLPLLAAHKLDLYQAMQPEHLGAPELSALIRAAAEQKVGFRAWLLLPKSDGYWPNEANLDPFSAALDQLLALIHDLHLPVAEVTFDLEPSWDYTQKVIKIGSNMNDPGRLNKLVALFKMHLDRPAYLANLARFQTLVDRVHAAGMAAHCVTYPMVIDDLADGDPDLQDALDVPVVGVSWDEVTLMVYRSTWETFANTTLSSDLMFQYGRDARMQFGAHAGVDLGVIGLDPVTMKGGYTDPAVLASDVSAARAASVDGALLHLYSLQTAMTVADVDGWLGFATTPAGAPPPTDPHVTNLREQFTVLDGILDPPM